MSQYRSFKKYGVSLVLILGANTALGQGLVGSKHDFSIQPWAAGGVCDICHTPHNANSTTAAPLWNHEATTEGFVVYDSPSMDVEPGQPGPSSKICLSCHDGTVAIDSYGGTPGTQYMTGSSMLSPDLADDHPVGLTWSHQTTVTSTICTNCHFSTNPLKFFGDKIECATCHEPHNNGAEGGGKMLRKTKVGSAICLHCHEK